MSDPSKPSTDDATSYRDYVAQTEQRVSHSKAQPFSKIGLLTKLGGNVRNWKERGFALHAERQVLHYFRFARDLQLYRSDMEANANRVAGTIPLKEARMFLAYYAEFDNCLEISVDSNGKKRHYYVHARNREVLQSWIRKLALTGVTFVCPTTNNEELKMILRDPASESAIYGMQGFMEKRGEWNKNFKKRFFRIESINGELNLVYYVNYDDTESRGIIPLLNAELKDAEVDAKANDRTKDSQQRTFHIHTPDRIFVVRPPTIKEKQIWFAILSLMAQNADSPPPKIKIPGYPPEPEPYDGNSSDSDADVPAREPTPSLEHQPDVHFDAQEAQAASMAADSKHLADDDDQEADFGSGTTDDAADTSADAGAGTTDADAAADAADATVTDADADADAGTGATEEAPATDVDAKSESSAPIIVDTTAQDLAALEKKSAEEEKLGDVPADSDDDIAFDDVKTRPTSISQAQITILRGGARFLKFGRRGNPHDKFVFVDGPRLYWSDKMGVKRQAKSLIVSCIHEILEGKKTVVFERAVAAGVPDDLCLSIVGAKRSLDLRAATKEQRDEWLTGLRNLVADVQS
jgi:PH domain